jgi:methionyl-tRNA synthetase
MTKFYLTAAIPYVNAKPHVGHALEFVQTDVIARYHRLLGEDTISLSGGDENALKNIQAAEAAKIPVQKFVDENTELFRQLATKLNAEFSVWQKGSDKKHHLSVQKLWGLCEKDIYKKKYEGLYCVGCEVFYSPEELDENGECHEHPGKKLERVSEENYFFKLSKYQDKLIKLITKDEIGIIPETRKNEVLSFLKQPLQDISVSRTNKRAKNWGVPVPGDSSQRIYVWFDALNIYQSGIGFGWDEKKYKKYWPADVHVIGKGITRFHAIYWPAFLLSAGLKLPKAIFVHGYLTVDGKKMSKSLGNVVDPVEIINKYGADPLRYYLLAKVSPFADGDFSEDKLIEVYNGELANGLGNTISRVAKLAETSGLTFPVKKSKKIYRNEQKMALEDFRFDSVLQSIWSLDLFPIDRHINQESPWARKGNELQRILQYEIDEIRLLAKKLKPFLPETADKIEKQFARSKIKSQAPLFPRIK